MKKATAKSPLAWFFLDDESAAATFRRDVEAHQATFEGIGCDPTGVTEGYAIFRDEKHLKSFSKKFFPLYRLNSFVM